MLSPRCFWQATDDLVFDVGETELRWEDTVVYNQEQRGLAHVEHEIVGRLPDLAERRPDVVDGALIHRIVRQVELGGPDPLRQDQQQLFDLLRRQRQLGYGRVGQV